MLEMYELKKHDLHEEKSATMEAQGQMCQKHVSWENLARVKRNSL